VSTWSPWESESGPWRPMSAADFAAELARSHPSLTVHRLIGHGGMGAVYAATDAASGRCLAIKMLRPDRQSHSEFAARFEREIDNLGRLRHRHIVAFHGADETSDGYRFFMMDLLEGESLAAVLARPSRLPLSRIVRIMTEVCAGVEHAHATNIVHRDLKASNVFIVHDDGRAVVLDFGIARDLTARPRSFSQGRIPGTDGHIAPELWDGYAARPPADIFSLGVIFLHMLIGKVPMVGHDSPSGYGFDGRLDEVVRKALSHDPAARYQRASDFAAALERATAPEPRPKSRIDARPPTFHVKPATGQADGSASPVAPVTKRLEPASDALLVQHRQFFASRPFSEHRRETKSIPVTECEKWVAIAQWDAYPEVPKGETIVRRLAMRELTAGAAAAVASVLTLVLAISAAAASSAGWGELIAGILLIWFIGSVVIGGGLYAGIRWLFDLMMKLGSGGATSWVKDPHFEEYLSREGSAAEQAALFNPRQLIWHANHPYLFVTRGYHQFASWELQEKRDETRGRRMIHEQMARIRRLFDVGHVEAAIFGEGAFLIQSQSFWWWDMNAATYHCIVYDQWGYECSTVSKRRRYPEPFGDLRSNPFRPQRMHDDEVLVLPARLILGVCHVHSLPKRLYLDGGDKLEQHATSLIDLADAIKLSDADEVTSFAWHPSGMYLVIVVAGALHLLHWDRAELVASQRPVGGRVEAAGWNAEGTLVALDAKQTRVWDVRDDTIRAPLPHERWTKRSDGTLEQKLTSCDGQRSFKALYGRRIVSNNFNPALDNVTDVAWSPHDPHMLATLGGPECPRDIRMAARRIRIDIRITITTRSCGTRSSWRPAIRLSSTCPGRLRSDIMYDASVPSVTARVPARRTAADTRPDTARSQWVDLGA
jgi:serine/threonine protein kinase